MNEQNVDYDNRRVNRGREGVLKNGKNYCGDVGTLCSLVNCS